MLNNIFLIYRSGGHLVWGSGTILKILVEDIIINISMKLYGFGPVDK